MIYNERINEENDRIKISFKLYRIINQQNTQDTKKMFHRKGAKTQRIYKKKICKSDN